jgi:hypothetical protein
MDREPRRGDEDCRDATAESPKEGSRMEASEKNRDGSGHRVQELTSLQGLTKRVTVRFNV